MYSNVILFIPYLFIAFILTFETNVNDFLLYASCFILAFVKFGIGIFLEKKGIKLKENTQQQELLKAEEKKTLVTKLSHGYKVDILETEHAKEDENTFLYSMLKRKKPNAKVKITFLNVEQPIVVLRDVHLSFGKENQLSYIDGSRLTHTIFKETNNNPYLGLELIIKKEEIS